MTGDVVFIFLVAFAVGMTLVVMFMHGARLADDNRADDLLPTDGPPVPYWPVEPFSEADAELVHAALVASPEFRAAMAEALAPCECDYDGTHAAWCATDRRRRAVTDPCPPGLVERCQARVMDEAALLHSLEGVI